MAVSDPKGFLSIQGEQPNQRNGPFSERHVSWIAEYVKAYMPEVNDLIEFLDGWVMKVCEYGYLIEKEKEVFRRGLAAVEKEWVDRARR